MTLSFDDGQFGVVFDGICQQVSEMDYESVLKELQEDIAEFEAGMFAGEFDSNLVSWPSLKPSTIRRKGHDRILVETGALRESLVSISGPGNVHDSYPRGMVFGTDVPYASFLQEGTSRIPARPPVGMGEESLDELTNRIADETVRQLTVSGGQ